MPLWPVWPEYVVADALAVLVIAPALLSLRRPYRPRGSAEAKQPVLGPSSDG